MQIYGFFLEKHQILKKKLFPQGLWKNGDSISEANFGKMFFEKMPTLTFLPKTSYKTSC